MKFEMRKLILLHIILLFSVVAMAQTVPVASGLPYECSFEEGETALNSWALNEGTPTAHDKWMVGTATHSDGKRSLYISADGQNPNYDSLPNIVVAYLRYQFPRSTQKEYYDISFDWRGVGEVNKSRLYVLAAPEPAFAMQGSPFNYNDLIALSPMGDAVLAPAVINQCVDFDPDANVDQFELCGSESWQNVSFEYDVSSTNSQENFRIMLIWVNNNKKGQIYDHSSIAIDNFQINSRRLKKPTNLDVIPQCGDSTLLVTWESGLGEFDLEYRSVGSSTWRKASGLTEGMADVTKTPITNPDGSAATRWTYLIRRIVEGSYDVRLRGVGDDLRTGFVYKNLILMYCPENHCINYIDLYDTNRVLCQYGHHPGSSHGGTPYAETGIIDNGPDSEFSRHTLHIDPTEVDPRTDSMLHTVPTGALASVRLGNWRTGGEAEAITYDIHVDTASQGILIVRYAVVFENPQGHPVEDEPAFKLEIMKPDGSLIDELCGQASFTFSSATEDPEHWHMSKNGDVAYRDWTVVGVSLMDFDNQNIKVRFTTLDCAYSGHYAYAYFTVDCANAHIETENCGSDAQITCVAPAGFNYLWYKDGNDEDTVSIAQTLEVAATKTHYTCRVSFIEEPRCYFEINTTSEPRFPVPAYTFERQYGECQSKLKFSNFSHVATMTIADTLNHTTEPCNDFHWEFKRLSNGAVKQTDARDPIYLCPEEGDSIEVKYTCYIGADNSCDSTRIDTIVVPNIHPKDSVFSVITCPEAPVQFGDDWFHTDTVVEHIFRNYAGCDSVVTMLMRVYPKPDDVYIHDSICSDQAVTINGVRYNQPMENHEIIMKTTHGCDSVLYLTLTVNERIKAQVDTLSFICADDEQLFLTFDIAKGVYDSIGIVFNTPALRDTMIYTPGLSEIVIPYPDTITPAVYQAEITFYQFCCGPYTQVRDIEIRYRSSIVEQKWNDVLTLLSPKYNGGYEFMAFQWYKDDMPIEGETHSYLYQDLDVNSIYYVELTRPDGTKMTTCPIQPVYHEQQTPYPTIVQVGQHMPIYMEQAATIWYYTISGQLYSTFTLPQGYTSLPTPGQTGAYIIRSVNANGESQAQVMIAE